MKHQCEKMVLSRGLNFSRERRCKNTATVIFEDKWYCGVHDPVSAIFRNQERAKRKERKNNINRILFLSKLASKNKGAQHGTSE